MNDATCNDEVESYTCTCVDGYNGTNCETGMLNLHIRLNISMNIFLSVNITRMYVSVNET